MKRYRAETMILPAILAATVLSLTIEAAQAEPPENRWEPKIAAFETADLEQPPPRHGILFVGSSSIRHWNLEEYFPDLTVINRGFGGSELSDSIHFAERIILPYKPRVVVVYAGDNDISREKSATRVLADYQALVARIHAGLPHARIVYIAIKPSIRRWELVGEMRQANRLIRQVAETDERLRFVDIDAPMIGDDGQPRVELFKKDGLHLNDQGYQLWTSLVLPHLRADE